MRCTTAGALRTPETVSWRDELLPRYRALVAGHAREVDTADDGTLAAMIDDIAAVAGEYLYSMTIVAGNAWKTESLLARFYARHLRPALGGSHQTLVAGLAELRPAEPMPSRASTGSARQRGNWALRRPRRPAATAPWSPSESAPNSGAVQRCRRGSVRASIPSSSSPSSMPGCARSRCHS